MYLLSSKSNQNGSVSVAGFSWISFGGLSRSGLGELGLPIDGLRMKDLSLMRTADPVVMTDSPLWSGRHSSIDPSMDQLRRDRFGEPWGIGSVA